MPVNLGHDINCKLFPGTGVVVFDPHNTFKWSITEREIKNLTSDIITLLPEDDDQLQKFLRAYIGLSPRREARWRGTLARMALNFRLVEAHLPQEGKWVDAGAFGLEATILKRLRPDASFSLYNYEGCAITKDKRGVHFLTDLAGSSDYIFIEQTDLERQPLNLQDSSVDVFATFETIEHFKFGPQLFISEANRVVKDGGILILSTPNATSIGAYERIILNLHPSECCTYHRNLDYGRIHPSEYDREQILDLISGNGFKIESIVTASFLPLTERQLSLIEDLVRIRNSRGLLISHDFGAKWIVIARKIATVTEKKFPPSLFEGA